MNSKNPVNPLLLASLLALGACVQGSEQTAAPAPIDPGRLMADVRMLTSPAFEGRRPGSDGHTRAQAFLVRRFEEIGLVSLGETYRQKFAATPQGASEPVEAANVMALCRGTSPGGPAMVITAHYDHEGIKDGVLYPGADDNASGVSVLLLAAGRCAERPYEHDAIFVAFDAEEMGLQGAKAFVASPPVPRERLVLNVNLDMVSRSDAREIYVAGTYHYPSLKPVLDEVAARAPVTVLFGHDRPKGDGGTQDDWTNQSDHGPFHAAGIPFVYFGVEDHADYHKPTDTADKIDPEFLRDVAVTVLDALRALDRHLP